MRRCAGIDVVLAARALKETPYHHGARLPGVGIDCIGVPFCAALACGFAVEDVTTYPLRPNGMLRPIMDSKMVAIPIPDRQPGDVLLMAFDGARPHHLAVYAGETIIHAHVRVRKCIEQPFDATWLGRTVGAYRFRELA